MAVVDNNILSSLAKIERLELLVRLFDSPGTVPSVVAELSRIEAAEYDYVDRIDDVKRYRDGWLGVISPTEAEIERAEEIRDHSLSFTDAECLAVAESRGRILLTDDGHVGEIASQRKVPVWDLRLLLEAAISEGLIDSEPELEAVITDLRDTDGYRFSADDRQALFDRF